MQIIATKANLIRAWAYPALFNAAYTACIKNDVPLYNIFTSDLTVRDILLSLSKAGVLKSPKKTYMFIRTFKSKNYAIRVLPPDEVFAGVYIKDTEEVGLPFKGKSGLLECGIKFLDRPIANFLSGYFNTLWEKAEPIENKWKKEIKSELKKLKLSVI